MPWQWLLILIVFAYLFVKLIQGIKDLVAWWREGRAFAEEQKRAQQRRRQKNLQTRDTSTLYGTIQSQSVREIRDGRSQQSQN